MKILVTGAKGLVGSALLRRAKISGIEIKGFSRQKLDINDRNAFKKALEEFPAEGVINAAAYTKVDQCEQEKDLAYQVNADAPGTLAKICGQKRIPFLHISTDYVFDGSKKAESSYTQSDPPNPLSVYGRSKLLGEQNVLKQGLGYGIIVRTGWIFGPGGKNFASQIFELAKSKQKIQGLSDVLGRPMYVNHLVDRIFLILKNGIPGLYHVTGGGEAVSWFEYAKEAFQIAGSDPKRIQEVKMTDLDRPAKRPSNSCMQCLQSPLLDWPSMPDWRLALTDWYQEIHQKFNEASKN